MNKAFEKILDMLKDTAKIEMQLHCGRCNGKTLALGYTKGIENAIKIVQEVAEEYKGGWIPCSERLPEEYTVLCCDKYGEMIVGHPYFDEVSNTNYSAESDNEMMYNCVAWQPLSEPYKERDSE